MQSSSDASVWLAVSFRSRKHRNVRKQPSPVVHAPTHSTVWCSTEQEPSSCGSHVTEHTACYVPPPEKRARLEIAATSCCTSEDPPSTVRQRVPVSEPAQISLRSRLPPKFAALTITPVTPAEISEGEVEVIRSPFDPTEPTPVYLGTSKLPVDGWFQSCRCVLWPGIRLGATGSVCALLVTRRRHQATCLTGAFYKVVAFSKYVNNLVALCEHWKCLFQTSVFVVLTPGFCTADA